MPIAEFYRDYFIPNQILYVTAFFILLTISYFAIYRKYIRVIPTDHLFVNFIYSTSGIALVFFMYLLDLIAIKHFLYFIISQFFFILGFITFKPYKGPKEVFKIDSKSVMINLIFHSSILLYILSISITYYFQGIPLLLENRLETYQSGGGIGILGRIINVMYPSIIYCLIYRIHVDNSLNKKISNKHILVIILLFITGTLSGSKSAILLIVFVFTYFVMYFHTNKTMSKSTKRVLYYLMFLGFISAFIILILPILKYNGNKLASLEIFYKRISISGDIFVFAYPNNIIDALKIPEPGYIALFKDFWGFSRILSPSEIPPPLGTAIYQYVNNTSIIGGSNSRHNVFGYIYFGIIGGVCFSYVLGIITSFFRNKLPKMLKTTPLSGLIYTQFSLVCLNLELDPVYTLGQINNLIFIFLPFIFILILTVNTYGSKARNYRSQL